MLNILLSLVILSAIIDQSTVEGIAPNPTNIQLSEAKSANCGIDFTITTKNVPVIIYPAPHRNMQYRNIF